MCTAGKCDVDKTDPTEKKACQDNAPSGKKYQSLVESADKCKVTCTYDDKSTKDVNVPDGQTTDKCKDTKVAPLTPTLTLTLSH